MSSSALHSSMEAQERGAPGSRGSASLEADREPLRVAMVAPCLHDGGLERMVRDLTLELDRSAFTPAVFTVLEPGHYAEDLREAGIAVWDCREPRIRIRGIPLRLIRRLASFEPDVIHAHSGTWFPAAVAKTVLRGPSLLYTEHGRYPPEPWLRSVIEAWCGWRTDLVAAVSGAVADYIADFARLRKAPVVLPNGIDIERFRTTDPSTRRKMRRELGVPDDATLFVSVGRMVEAKNHAVLLEAFRRVRETCPDAHLALIGDGPLEEELRRQAERLALGDHVLFPGFRDDVELCLHASDVFVLPSRTEGMPLALLEALAAGLPTIASDVGGVGEVLGEPPAGLLVPAGRVDELAGAMGEVATSGPLRTRLSERARERSEKFSLAVMTSGYAEVYRELVRERRKW